jgi:hypothetical protein
MTHPQIDYASLVESALLRVVHDVLATVAKDGLPGRHHLYITLRTDHPGVVIDDALRARYPNEMTIVLQHEFWGLEVEDEGFAITLKFSGLPQRLEIPFAAVTVFADPSVEFGLQFNLTNRAEVDDEQEDDADEAADMPEGGVTAMPQPEAGGGAAAKTQKAVQDGDGAEVVTLDQFRKKS